MASRIRGSLVTLAIVIATVGPSRPVRSAETVTSGLDVVFLANEGVYLSGGGRAVVIDGCVREPYSGYGAVPDDAWAKLLQHEAPFERLDVVLVSHAHRDHFQADACRELLLARPEARFVVHREVVALLAADWPRWKEVAGRVIEVAPADGKPERHRGDGVEVEIFRLPHGAARTLPENLAHIVTLGGRTAVHVGDAEASAAALERAGLAGRTVDVGLLPYWYWSGDEWSAARAALSGRLGTIALHRPPAEAPATGPGTPQAFRKALERIRF